MSEIETVKIETVETWTVQWNQVRDGVTYMGPNERKNNWYRCNPLYEPKLQAACKRCWEKNRPLEDNEIRTRARTLSMAIGPDGDRVVFSDTDFGFWRPGNVSLWGHENAARIQAFWDKNRPLEDNEIRMTGWKVMKMRIEGNSVIVFDDFGTVADWIEGKSPGTAPAPERIQAFWEKNKPDFELSYKPRHEWPCAIEGGDYVKFKTEEAGFALEMSDRGKVRVIELTPEHAREFAEAILAELGNK